MQIFFNSFYPTVRLQVSWFANLKVNVVFAIVYVLEYMITMNVIIKLNVRLRIQRQRTNFLKTYSLFVKEHISLRKWYKIFANDSTSAN